MGRQLAPRLAAAFPDDEIVAVVRKDAARGQVACDLSAEAETLALFERVRPTVVVHLAAYSSVGLAQANPVAVWRDNAIATCHLAAAVRRSCPSATVFFASSGEVYGRAFADGPVSEETPAQPANAYAASKLAGEQALATVLPQSARLMIARAFHHTGTGQGEAFAIPSFAAQIARIEAGLEDRLKVGNLDVARDFLDVRDVADAYVRLIAHARTLERSAVTVNLGRGRATPLREIVEVLRRAARAPIEVATDPRRMRAGEVKCATTRLDRLASLIDWPAPRPLSETLLAVLEDKRAGVGFRPDEPAAPPALDKVALD